MGNIYTQADNTGEFSFGSTYPPVKIFLDMAEIAGLNSLKPVYKKVILTDGKELDLEFYLETDKNAFSKHLREALREVKDIS
jgi:hypothetical protein